jgi:hypothetical protein
MKEKQGLRRAESPVEEDKSKDIMMGGRSTGQ